MVKRGIMIYSIGIAIILAVLYYLQGTSYFAGGLTFILSTLLIYFSDKYFKLGLRWYHYFILILMALAGLFLSPLYEVFIFYDKILHFINPILGCFVIFYLVDKSDLDLRMKLFLTFTVMITIISFAEIIEFILDRVFDSRLQGVFKGGLEGMLKYAGNSEIQIIQDKNTDTMIDLILGFLGSMVFVFSRFFYEKLRK
jgi:hypothetical protein